MASTYQTVFGVSPVSEPTTSFSTPIEKSTNTETDQSIGNLFVGAANTFNQVTKLVNEIGSADFGNKVDTGLNQEIVKLTTDSEYMAAVKKEFNKAGKISNSTASNLKLTQLRNTYLKGASKKDREIVNRIFQQTIGTVSPAGSLLEYDAKVEHAAGVALLTEKNRRLKIAEANNIVALNRDGSRDEAKTLAILSTLEANGVLSSAIKSSLKKGGSVSNQNVRFRGNHIAAFDKLKDGAFKEVSIRISGLLNNYRFANEIQKPVIAAALGNVIENMRSETSKRFTENSGEKYLTEAELAYITDEPMGIFRSLIKGSGLEDAWRTGKLTEGKQLEELTGTLELMANKEMMSFGSIRLFKALSKNMGDASVNILMKKLPTLEQDLEKVATRLETSQSALVKKALKALTEPKYLKTLGKEDKQALGLFVKGIVESGPEVIKETTKRKSNKEVGEFCAGVIGMAEECLTSFDSPENKDALMELLSSENGLEIIQNLKKAGENSPEKQTVYNKLFKTLNDTTARKVPELVVDLVENIHDKFEIPLKEGDLIWSYDDFNEGALVFSQSFKDRVKAENPDEKVDNLWAALGDEGDEIDTMIQRIGKFHDVIGPKDNTNKTIGKVKWLQELMAGYAKAAITGTPYTKGWFGLGGLPKGQGPSMEKLTSGETPGWSRQNQNQKNKKRTIDLTK
tara:strand:- start:1100 stop:3151 length:2052 start_codon:yes stop_codon:yes gene_type:complete